MELKCIFVYLKASGTAVGTGIIALLGGWDKALEALVVLTVLDYVAGVLEAIIKRKVSSAIGYKGIIRKAYAFLIIMAVAALEKTAIPQVPPVAHTAVAVWFCINEVISILEHARAVGTTVPQVLVDLIKKLRDAYNKHLPGMGGNPTEDNTNEQSTPGARA